MFENSSEEVTPNPTDPTDPTQPTQPPGGQGVSRVRRGLKVNNKEDNKVDNKVDKDNLRPLDPLTL